MAGATRAAEGSVSAISRGLLLWGSDPGSGLCRVEVVDQESRKRVVERIRTSLAERGIAFFEIALPRGRAPEEAALWLAGQLRELSPGVVSISGFAAAFHPGLGLDRFLQALNYQREQLARPGLRQIWWMEAHISQEFTRQIPDLDSWFQIRLSLTEVLPRGFETPLPPPDLLPKVPADRSLSDDVGPLEARAHLAEAKARVEQATRRGRLEQSARSTLDRALRELRRAGAGSEADAEERALQKQYPELWTSSATDPDTPVSSYRANPLPPREMLNVRLGERFPGPEASLLNLLAHLAPAPIPLAMLEENEGLLREAAGGDLRLAEALAGLERSSLLSLGRQGDQKTLLLSRRLQAEVRSRIPKNERRTWAVRAVRLVLDFAPKEPKDPRNWPVWELLHPHAARVIEIADAQQVGAPVAVLMNQLGMFLQSKALFGVAEPLFRRALAIDEERLGKDHPNIARDLNNLATLLQATSRLEEAESLLRRALAIDEADLGPDHPVLAVRLNNLAAVLKEAGRLDEAELLLRRALALDEASLGHNHPNVAGCLSNLAALLQETNRPEEAEPLLRRALAIDEASLGPDHPNVAIDLNNVATLLQATTRLEEAEPLLRRALAIDEWNLGPDHPNVAVYLNNLAQLLRAMRRLEEAEPLLRRALAIDEASLGPDHPNVAIDLNNLARLLQDTNRVEEAEPLMRRALAIFEAGLGKNHPSTSKVRTNLETLVRQRTNPSS